MTRIEQLEQQFKQLPSEKQNEVLDFVMFLRQRLPVASSAQPRSLRKHPAFGSWRSRHIDALQYQQDLRAEWDPRS